MEVSRINCHTQVLLEEKKILPEKLLVKGCMMREQ
jgi:hypothetical protein